MIIKKMKGAEQQTNFEESDKFIEKYLMRYAKSTQRKKSFQSQSFNFPKLDNLPTKDLFLNTQKLTTLNLTQNLDFMDPNDVTYQLNKMISKNRFIQQKPIVRIHQSLQPKRRLTSKMLHELSKTTRVI